MTRTVQHVWIAMFMAMICLHTIGRLCMLNVSYPVTTARATVEQGLTYCTNAPRSVNSITGPWFNIKMSSYQYRKSHCGDKTILRPSYLHNGISYTGKMISLYWIGALDLMTVTRSGQFGINSTAVAYYTHTNSSIENGMYCTDAFENGYGKRNWSS